MNDQNVRPTSPCNDCNALALEYEREYGSAHGNLDIANIVNNPAANGKCGVFGTSFGEQGVNLFPPDLRTLDQNAPNPLNVASDRIKALP